MYRITLHITTLLIVLMFHLLCAAAQTQYILSDKQKSIALIAAWTALGDLIQLNTALNEALDFGITINETKEIIVHTYAYCVFPRSIQGLNTLMSVLEERKSKGIIDPIGREATPIADTNKYEIGWRNLAKLSGRPANGPIEKPTSGYGALSPEMDRFLKEHLFADIFSRDVLTFAERELATVSVLIALEKGVEPMLESHFRLAMLQGISSQQLDELLKLIETTVSKENAAAARKILSGLKM